MSSRATIAAVPDPRADDPAAPIARHPRREAQEVAGDGYAAYVLEPSPPAVLEGEWFADDPVAVEVVGDRTGPALRPVPGAGPTWDEWLAGHPEHVPWAAARWLGGRRRLEAPPADLATTRLALHRLAVYVVSPARRRANGKIALRSTFGGIGTPFFGADEQVRVVGTTVVRQRGETAAARGITTLNDAAAFVLDGPPDVAWAEGFDVPPPGDLDEVLPVAASASSFLGDWFGFAWSVLEELRAEATSVEAGRVQLWPEHFDAAFDCLSDGEHRRATFGASPGDAAVAEPYLYVTPWHFGDVAPGELWDAEPFDGALLPLSAFVGAGDQRATALEFFRRRRDALAG